METAILLFHIHIFIQNLSSVISLYNMKCGLKSAWTSKLQLVLCTHKIFPLSIWFPIWRCEIKPHFLLNCDTTQGGLTSNTAIIHETRASCHVLCWETYNTRHVFPWTCATGLCYDIRGWTLVIQSLWTWEPAKIWMIENRKWNEWMVF